MDEETDLAVLTVNATGLPAAEFGDSDQLRAGQIVCAFGSALGLENSMTLGVVNAVGRQLAADDPMVYIPTDAPINPGNSGGALVDVQGRVVGINTLILSQGGGNEGRGFAVPSNIVRTVFEQLRRWGRVRRGTIGVAAQTITPTLAEALRLPRDTGVILADVFPEESGAAAGLVGGDIVLALDGKPMENGRQFEVDLYRRAAGDSAVLDVLRGDARVRVDVAIAERTGDPTRFADLVTPGRNLVERLGILGLDIDAGLAAACAERAACSWPRAHSKPARSTASRRAASCSPSTGRRCGTWPSCVRRWTGSPPTRRAPSRCSATARCCFCRSKSNIE